MGKLICPSLILLVAVTTPAIAQTTNPIFLDCYVDQTVSKPAKDDAKIPSGYVYYKIDIQKSDVSKLDKDDGKYKTLCSDLKKPREFGVLQGWCTISEDHVRASGDAVFLDFTVVEYLSLYRYSGKISTNTRIYSGIATKLEDRIKVENITHRVETEGTCKQGSDMSLKQKAF
jgi:hypothetical protein